MSERQGVRPLWQRAIGCLTLILLLPVILVLLILKLLCLPFEKRSHRSAEEIARSLRQFVDGAGGDWDFDDFTSIPLADPRLDSIRERALAWPDAIGIADLLMLADEAEALAAQDREILIALLRRAIDEGGVTAPEVYEALPWPRSLGDAEVEAYTALIRWADDDDIRAREPAYAERQRRELAEQLASLAATRRA